MFVNRVSESFGNPSQILANVNLGCPPTQQILSLINVNDIYQAAAERAYHDHQLDKLFNAEFYGDHGSGI